MRKKVASMLTALCMTASMIAAVPFTARAEEMGGTWGDNLTWTLDSEGVLRISGIGEMEEGLDLFAGGYAFDPPDKYPWQGNKDIKKVIVEEGVTSLDAMSFWQCTNLESIEIAGGVKTIYGTFEDCDNLNDIHLPDSISEISSRAFNDTKYYKDKSKWDNGVLYIDNILITTENEDMENYTVRQGTTCIAELRSKNLVSITLPDGLKSINSIGGEKLETINIPDTVTNIGNEMIVNQFIGGGAFSGCKSLKSINIPNGVTQIKRETFSNCESLNDINIPNSVTQIDERAFENCKGLNGITIPNSVTQIGYEAFKNCKGLNSINLSDNIVNIERGVFSGTAYYNNADNWDNDTLYIGDYLIAYKGADSENYTVRDGIKCIAGEFLSDEAKGVIKTVNLPDSIIGISDSAFSKAYNLRDINMPDSIRYIGSDAFAWSNISTVRLPANLTTINQSTFNMCGNLREVYIPEGVTSIEMMAFRVCSSLEKVIFPDSVKTIGYKAFSGCEKLNNLTLPKELKRLDGDAFADCKMLESVVLPPNITFIRSSAFWGCSRLREIYIPKNVTQIGEEVFAGCSELTDVYYDGTKDDWDKIKILEENEPLINAVIHYNDEESKLLNSDADNEIAMMIGKKIMNVFGETRSNDVAPIVKNDRTMLPARFVAESLGARVAWDGVNHKVTITKDDTVIVLTIGSDEALVNGETIILDSPAFVENDRTYTPIRFIAEKLGAAVDWNQDTKEVIITK